MLMLAPAWSSNFMRCLESVFLRTWGGVFDPIDFWYPHAHSHVLFFNNVISTSYLFWYWLLKPAKFNSDECAAKQEHVTMLMPAWPCDKATQLQVRPGNHTSLSPLVTSPLSFMSHLSLWRDLFINTGFEVWFSAVTLKFDFLPWNWFIHTINIRTLYSSINFIVKYTTSFINLLIALYMLSFAHI